MKHLILILFLFLPVVAYSQTDGDSILVSGKGLKTDIEKTEFSSDFKSSDMLHSADYTPSVPTYKPLRTMTMEELNITQKDINDFYVGPPLQQSTFRLPNINDHSFHTLYNLAPTLGMTTHSTLITDIGIGSVVAMGARLHYQPSDWLQLSGGPSIYKYKVGYTHDNDIGVGGSARFIVSDRINFKAFGNYSVKAKYGAPSMTTSPGAYPERSYGGVVEYKVTDKFGVGVGMERKINPWTGKWENNPILYPIFYK